ncbi:S-adenosyl-L-methionine-dependent methyltransferase [Amylostereum chailletii]|nr:S-adenosyl-L-methionine-dependent methyltransferase [Amylostereum chailletii]
MSTTTIVQTVTLPLAPKSFGAVYVLSAEPEAEADRLDGWHQGIRRYIGDKLTMAPLKNPKRILELGVGSGAWVIEAANTYPEAEVVAVDISPGPGRPLPSNATYVQRNILDPMPWPEASFDVIHCRFILCHVSPEPARCAPRIIALLKPGGWLLVDDADCRSAYEGNASTVGRCMDVYINFMTSRDQDPHIGAKLATMLQQSNQFDQVHTRTALVPLNPHLVPDPDVRILTETMLKAYSDAMHGSLSQKLGPQAPELLKQWREETSRKSGWKCDQLFTVTWSRKRLY